MKKNQRYIPIKAKIAVLVLLEIHKGNDYCKKKLFKNIHTSIKTFYIYYLKVKCHKRKQKGRFPCLFYTKYLLKLLIVMETGAQTQFYKANYKVQNINVFLIINF